MMTIQDLFDLSKTIAAPLFAGKTYPWEALAEIGDFILQLGPTLPAEEYEQRGENILTKPKLLALGDRLEKEIAERRAADAPYR